MRARTVARAAATALACSLLVLVSHPVAAGDRPWGAFPEPVASYTIDVHYDADRQVVSGHQTLHWRNTTAHPADELRFHLYLNAFANNRSTFMRSLGNDWLDWAAGHHDPWGYTEVSSIRVGDADLLDAARFIQPDDGNADDRTVLAVPLPQPVSAGAGVEVRIEFTSKLPRALARAGHAGPYVFVAQWFPKIGVFEPDGRWNCRQYHRTTEFYADFGTYDVTITVPADRVVGATGKLVQQSEQPGGIRRLRFVAEGVHDFAWVADPRFEVVEEEFSGVAVRLLLQPRHRGQGKRYLEALRAAIARYERWIGLYPYESITLVDPGPGARATGGMEYPTLITLGTAWWMPTGLRIPEVLTVHEFGHQYWHGMVANDEVEHAWLDEGVNSYLEGKIMDAAYGAAGYVDLFGLRADRIVYWRVAYLRASGFDAIMHPAWQFIDQRSYTAVTYAKTALALETLDRHFGNGIVLEALADYFQRQRFQHPRPQDLLEALERRAGQNLSWYIDPVFGGTGVVDYAVTRVESTELRPLTGYAWLGTLVDRRLDPDQADGQEARAYRNQVVVQRQGEVSFPVRVEVRFDDGTSASEEWDGQERWRRFDYSGSQRVEWAVVDPEEKVVLDINRLNNSRMRQASTRGVVRLTARWGFWFQSVLHVLAGM